MNVMRKTGMTLFLLIVCALMGAGCVKIDATLSLDRDGGGTFRVIYAMPTFVVKQMETTRQLSRSLVSAEGKATNAPLQALDIPQVFDEADLKSKFKAMEASGVTLEALRTRDQGGWKYVDFSLRFKRLEALASQSFFKDCGIRLSRMGDDTSKLAISPPALGVPSGLPDIGNQETSAKLTPFLSGMRVVVRIDFPGEIRNSTSAMSDNFRATWEWDFEKDAHMLERLSQDKIIAVFDGRMVRIKEFEKPAGSVIAR